MDFQQYSGQVVAPSAPIMTPPDQPGTKAVKQANSAKIVAIVVLVLIVLAGIGTLIWYIIYSNMSKEQVGEGGTKLALDGVSQMQEATGEMCKNSEEFLTNGKTYTLTDSRDLKSYKIRKLKDGNCWMVTNLALAGGKKITAEDSDVEAEYTLPASAESGFMTADKAEMFSGTSDTGGYYNWYAATAGTGTTAMSSGKAKSSICPKGWTLPIGGTNSQFDILRQNYAVAVDFLRAYSPTFAGAFMDNARLKQGALGGWWSSTVYDSTHANAWQMEGDTRAEMVYELKNVGYSVRCVLNAAA